MASNLGTVFVELSLDDKVYKQKLGETLTSTEATAKGIEASWKALGTKSDAVFNSQRLAAENAYTLISKAGTFSAEEIARAQKASADKIMQINEQQFGKQSTLIDNIKKNWMGMAATATAVYMAIEQVVAKPIAAYMESEKALLKMGLAMKNQGDFTRAGLADLEEFSKQIQTTTAYEDDFTLAVMGNLKSYGMTNEEVKKATQTALDFATAKANEGMTVEKASEILGKAYLGQTTGLKKLGIQVSENAHGAGVFDAVMGQLQQRFGGSAQAELLTYEGQWKQLKNQWGDIQEFLGLVFLKTMEGLMTTAGLLATSFMTAGNAILGMLRIITTPLEKMLDGIAWLAEKAGMQGLADGLRSVTGAIDKAQKSIKGAREGVIAWTSKQYDNLAASNKVVVAIDNMGKAGQRTTAINTELAAAQKKAAQEHEAAVKSIEEAIKAANIEIEGSNQTQYSKDMLRIQSKADEYSKKGVDRIKLSEFIAAEVTAVESKAEEQRLKDEQKAAQEYLKEFEKIQQAEVDAAQKASNEMEKFQIDYFENSRKEWVKGNEEWARLKTADVDFASTENERAINKIKADEQKKLDDLQEMYNNFHDTGMFSEEEYQKEVDKTRTKYRTARETSESEQAKKIADINYNLVNKIKGYEDVAYDSRLTQISDMANAYKLAGADQEKIAAWVTDEIKKLDIEKGKSSDSWVGGAKSALQELADAHVSWGKTAYDAVKQFAADATSQISTYFFDVITGKLEGQKKKFETEAAAETTAVIKEKDSAIKEILVKEKQLNTDIGKEYEKAHEAFVAAEKAKIDETETRISAIKTAEAKSIEDVEKLYMTGQEKRDAKAQDISVKLQKTITDAKAAEESKTNVIKQNLDNISKVTEKSLGLNESLYTDSVKKIKMIEDEKQAQIQRGYDETLAANQLYLKTMHNDEVENLKYKERREEEIQSVAKMAEEAKLQAHQEALRLMEAAELEYNANKQELSVATQQAAVSAAFEMAELANQTSNIIEEAELEKFRALQSIDQDSKSAFEKMEADKVVIHQKAIDDMELAEDDKRKELERLYGLDKTAFDTASGEKEKAHIAALENIKETQKTAQGKIDDINTKLQGNIGSLGINWDKLWQGMAQSVINNVATMITSWASLKILEIGGRAFDWLFAKEGMWEVPAAGVPGDEVPIIAHAGEMILKKELAGEVRDYLTESAPSGLNTAGTMVEGIGGIIGGWIGGKVGSSAGGETGGIIGTTTGALAGKQAGAYAAAQLGMTKLATAQAWQLAYEIAFEQAIASGATTAAAETAGMAAAGEVGAGGGAGLGAYTGVAAIVAAAIILKQKYGEPETGWDEKSGWGKFFYAPGLSSIPGMIPFGYMAKEGTVVGDVFRELARLEDFVMQPIEALLGFGGPKGTPWWETATSPEEAAFGVTNYNKILRDASVRNDPESPFEPFTSEELKLMYTNTWAEWLYRHGASWDAAILNAQMNYGDSNAELLGASAHEGIDYVPYDNYHIRAHEGEAILKKSDAEGWRKDKSSSINFTWSGNIIASDKSPERIAREIARPLKDELRRLAAIGA